MKKSAILLLAGAFASVLVCQAQNISYSHYHQLRQPVPMILDTDFGSCTRAVFCRNSVIYVKILQTV